MNRIAFASAIIMAAAGTTQAASTIGSNFDQIEQVNTLGGTVFQIGGAGNGTQLFDSGDFVGGTSASTGVDVNLPGGWLYLNAVTGSNLNSNEPGTIATAILGAPTDATFTVPGAGGPDGTAGDGSVQFLSQDFLQGTFPNPISPFNGADANLFIFTNTANGGTINVELLLGANVVDSLQVAISGATAGTGTGGALIDVPNGTAFDGVRITGVSGSVEVDAVAGFGGIPNPGPLSLLALAGVVAGRRRGR